MRRCKKIAALLCALAMMASILSVGAWAAPSDIAVQVNGQEVSFPDARPEVRNGRTMIPMRAAFETLGAQVTWNPEQQSVTAVKGDTTVVMTLGSTNVSVTENGEQRQLQMDVAPYSRNSRTYVPVRFAAQAFSCAVGWDGDARTVILVDIDQLLGDATFRNLDGWIQADLKQETPNPAKTTGKASVKLTVADTDGKMQTYPLSAVFSGISNETQAQMQLEMDFSELASLLLDGADLGTAEKNELKKLCKAAVDTRMDMAAGKVYFNIDCPLLLQMIGESLGDSNVWYFADMKELNTAGFDYTAYVQNLKNLLSSGDAGFRDLLVSMFSGMELTDTAEYEQLQVSMDVIRTLLSDQTMTRSGSDYTAKWAAQSDGINMQVAMTYQTSGSRLTGMKMALSADDGESPVTAAFQVRSDGKNTAMTLDLDLAAEMKLHFDLSAETVKSNAQPDVQPPAGSKIVDIMDALGAAAAPYDTIAKEAAGA